MSSLDAGGDAADPPDESSPVTAPKKSRKRRSGAVVKEPEAPAGGVVPSTDEAEASKASQPAAMTADERAAAIATFAGLPRAERDAARVAEARRLNLTRAALDAAVKSVLAKRRADAEKAARAVPEPGPGEVIWPPGFRMDEQGLTADAGDDAPPLWIAAPFEVMGESRNAAGEGWGLMLRWRDRDRRIHPWPMPARLLMVGPGELEAELVSRGLRIAAEGAARMALRKALGEVRAGSRVRLADRAGWHGAPGRAFVLVDGDVIGDAEGEAIVLGSPPEDAERLCAASGSLVGWQRDVAALASGNPLAAFCMAAAFAGPLIGLLGETGGGFHLFGDSKRGKTTAVQLGLSAWGLPTKGSALRDWNGTANSFEAAAEESGDGLLALDELHQAPAADVGRLAYALADGAGRARLNRDATAKRRRSWRCMILSTGEHDLATAAARGGTALPAGADVRLPSLRVPDASEAWPCLHGRASLGALWADLHRAMRQHHGEAARAFLQALVEADHDDLTEGAAVMRDRIASALPADADPQVRDVARRFALVAFAGELATRSGVLPWPAGEAERAAASMLAGWLRQRPGGAGSAEREAHLAAVRKFLVAHGASRFTVLTQGAGGSWEEAHGDRPVANRAGWRKRGERDEYLIMPEVFRDEIARAAGFDPTALAQTLAEAGALKCGRVRLTMTVRIPGCGTVRLYAISATLIEDSDDADARPAAADGERPPWRRAGVPPLALVRETG